MTRPRAFDELLDVASIVTRARSTERARSSLDAFDGIGLILKRDTGRDTYESTPMNCDTFAHTGGDGTHYSFLHDRERHDHDYPIVMTVPMMSANIVVGGNLVEFLALGCAVGYFWLEQLAYDFAPTAAEVQAGRDLSEMNEFDLLGLAEIRARFAIEPWREVSRRLDELRAEYSPCIHVQDDAGS